MTSTLARTGGWQLFWPWPEAVWFRDSAMLKLHCATCGPDADVAETLVKNVLTAVNQATI